MRFGDKMRELRQEAKLTQPELAEKLGVEQSWLSKIETDKCLPSSDFLNQVLEIFEISLQELLEDLDDDHVHNQLSSLPEIKHALDTVSRRDFHSRKRWIVLSSMACVIGTVLLYAAIANLFFLNTAQRYVSNGLIYSGEPWDLYDRTESYFSLLNMFKVPAELKSQYSDDGRSMTGDLRQLYLAERGKFIQDLWARRSFSEFLSYRDEMEYIILPAEVSAGATDIFGNSATGAQRVYEIHDRVRPNLLNSIVWVLGCVFLVGGLFGFFVDYRLSNLRD